MRNKMITLCPTTYETAKKIPNFSAWVRNRLRDLEQYTPETRIEHEYKCPLCKEITTYSTRHARKCTRCDYAMSYITGRNFE